MRYLLAVPVVLLLTACWPGPGDYAAMPASEELIERYNHASKKQLGSSVDDNEIRKAIANEPSAIDEIRWVSPVEVIVSASASKLGGPGVDHFYIEVHKGGSGWQRDAPYLDDRRD